MEENKCLFDNCNNNANYTNLTIGLQVCKEHHNPDVMLKDLPELFLKAMKEEYEKKQAKANK